MALASLLLQQTPALLPACVPALLRLGDALSAAASASHSGSGSNSLASPSPGGRRHFASSPPPHVAPAQQPAAAAAPLDFDDYARIFGMRSTPELLRAYLVLQACSVTPLVRHADAIVRGSRRLLGDRLTFAALRATFFRQFCAGEREEDMWPTISALRDSGIGAIIDYAAEDDVEAAPAKPPAPAAAPSTGGPGPGPGPGGEEGVAVGRQYSYEGEAACDRHVGVFLNAIGTSARLPGDGFAAIKVTALGNPQLLERMSGALLEIRHLFREADTDGDGFVDLPEFTSLYLRLFPASDAAAAAAAFATLDLEGAGRVDVVSWSHRIRLADMPGMVERIRRQGTRTRLSDELCAVALTQEEVALAEALLGRVAKLAAAASEQGVRLMIDAEHTYFQPAIDHTTHVLSLTYNKERPVIFNTYQAYLKDCFTRMSEDMERARRENYVFAAKIVRGAYVQLERARAARLKYESPIWEAIEGTHASYNRCLDAVLDEVASSRAEVMVASHNQASVERTVAGMAARGLAPSGSGVYFGQLLGMADNLTFTLGQHGYQAYKYTPYGPIDLVLPYLIRRAHENSAIMGAGVTRQLGALQSELRRRLLRPWAARGGGGGGGGATAHAAA